MKSWTKLTALALVALLGVTGGAAWGQTDVTTTRISGTVSDAEGVALPGVTVAIKNNETGLSVSTVTVFVCPPAWAPASKSVMSWVRWSR